MENCLVPRVRAELEKAVRCAKTIDERNRLCCILSYDKGKTVQEISAILWLDFNTVYKYIRDYQQNNKMKNDPRGGSPSKLSSPQEEDLKDHLKQRVYLYVKDIIAHIQQRYQVVYTRSGLTKWLKKQGFCYKKPATIPGKLCPQQQEEFIGKYKELRDNLAEDEEIFFVDSVHPAHQSQAVSGWILKGEQKHLQTTAKQHRVHYTGALALGKGEERHRIVYSQSATVNQETTIDFFKTLEEKTPGRVIHVICDNAMYFKGKKVKDYLSTSRIKLHHLPPYSPNLNPIERLWKIMRESVYYNKYYQDFNSFCGAIEQFFSEKIDQLSQKIKNRINDNFQCFKPNIISLVELVV
jgi:transposase